MANLVVKLVISEKVPTASKAAAVQLAFNHATQTPKAEWEHPSSMMVSTKTKHKSGSITVEIGLAEALG